MGLTEEQKEMVKKFVGDNISSNKKIDDHLEKMYRKKEKSLTKEIKNKTREFKGILLKNGFKEAEFYVENRLWKWKFFKVTSEDVAFVINLEPHDNYIEIYYGYCAKPC